MFCAGPFLRHNAVMDHKSRNESQHCGLTLVAVVLRVIPATRFSLFGFSFYLGHARMYAAPQPCSSFLKVGGPELTVVHYYYIPLFFTCQGQVLVHKLPATAASSTTWATAGNDRAGATTFRIDYIISDTTTTNDWPITTAFSGYTLSTTRRSVNDVG
jgi:hypothetical protein